MLIIKLGVNSKENQATHFATLTSLNKFCANVCNIQPCHHLSPKACPDGERPMIKLAYGRSRFRSTSDIKRATEPRSTWY